MRVLFACFAFAASLLAQSPSIDPNKVIDLTYTFDSSTVYWPTAKPFEWQKEQWGRTPKGYFYAAARYAASEHGGTHFDSPIHFSEGKQTIDQIPVSKLVGKALVIDVRPKVGAHPDSLITASDLLAWEKVHGKIQEGSIVIAHTGWGQYWPDKKKYIGTDKPGDAANLHFPGYAKDAAELLASRKVAGVGIDTPSLDYGQSNDFIAHQVLNGANIYGLENVANLEKLPTRGATVIALPMKIGGGSGAPARIIAILP
jgi:kynurenine formamidase